MVSLLARLVQALSNQGNYASALTYANRRLALAPWQEEAHRQVMRLRLYNGQRNEALVQYECCVALLADELGVEPDAKTQALHAQIKTAAPFPPHNLPPQTTPFVGRQAELADLTRRLADPDQRLITLTGAGGMGKTRLALAAVERQLGRPTEDADAASPTYAYFTHGVYWVSLAAIESASSVISAIAAALDFSLDADGAERTAADELLDYLRAKRLLLILDNFEQLLQPTEAEAATALLLAILRVAPEVQLLVTSRERLQVTTEQLYPVQGLAYPDADADTTTLAYPALALFTQVAQQRQPTFRCEWETAAIVAEICRAVAGMPLAIELAAAAVTIRSPAEILAELTRSLDLLATANRHIPDRHRSMRAAFEVSWQQLSPAEQVTFAQLSLFRNGFTREAATAVTSASLAVLSGLADKSFIRYRLRTERYEIHELLRQLGEEQLALAPDRSRQASQQHSAYFTAKLAQWGDEMKGTRQQATLQMMEADGENIRLAWLWMMDEADVAHLSQAVDGFGFFHQWQGRYQDGANLLHVANRALRELTADPEDQRVLLIKMLTWEGIFEQNLGHTQPALALFEEALRWNDTGERTLAPPQPRQRAQAFLWLALGDAYLHIDRDKVRTYYEQSIAAYQALGDQWGLSRAYDGLSWLVRELGDYPTAKVLAEKSLALREELGDQQGIADSLGHLGLIVMDMGELVDAETFTSQKLAIHRQLNNRPKIASALDNLGLVDLFLGQNEAAQQKFEECLVIYTELGVQQRHGTAFLWLGIALCMQGRYHDAQTNGTIGLELAEAADNPWLTGNAHMLLGYLALALGQPDDARAHIRVAIDGFEQLGQQDELGQAWVWKSYGELECGQLAAAQDRLVRSLQIILEVRTILPVLKALPAAAKLLYRQEEPVLAVEIYALAMSFPMLANSSLIEDLAGKSVRMAANILPPADVAAAQERGRQRHLWETAAALLARFTAV